MGFRDKLSSAKKRIEVEKIKYEQRELARLKKQRVKAESSAIRSKLRQKERERIAKARKTISKGKPKRNYGGSVDFGNIFFDSGTKKRTVKRTTKRK